MIGNCRKKAKEEGFREKLSPVSSDFKTCGTHVRDTRQVGFLDKYTSQNSLPLEYHCPRLNSLLSYPKVRHLI